jgi:Flp pilus assembly pilin Flp
MKWVRIFNKKGQNTAEYAILIGLVVAVAVAMQTYVKRGLQGRVHDASDKLYNSIADADWTNISTIGATKLSSKQYEPEKLSSKSTQQVHKDDENYTMDAGGTVTRESTLNTQQAKDDYQLYQYK